MRLLVLAAALATGWLVDPSWLSALTGSAATTLGWQAQVATGALAQVAPVAGAVATGLGVPALVAMIAEASRGGRGPRGCTVLLLAAVGAWGLAGPDGWPMAGLCVLLAVAVAAPGRLSAIAVTGLLGVVTGHWAALLVHGHGPVGAAAADLADVVGGRTSWWVALLLAGSVACLAGTLRFLLRTQGTPG